MKIVLWALLLLLGLPAARAQQEEIRWLSIEEAEKLSNESPRPLILDFYTDWCGWCKHMDKTTYSDPLVISFINKHFYPVRINAESGDTMTFRGKKYVPLKNGTRSVNGLAVELLGGKMSYPTTVFVYDKEKINLVVPGYTDVPKMQGFLIYFIENAYQSTNINDFLADFEEVFTPASKVDEVANNYWTDFKDLESRRKEKSKKILLFIDASWSNSSKMMERLVFPDSVFCDIASRYFYCLRLDAQSKDSIVFMTHHFANAGSANNDLHQLAIALSDRVLRVPGVFIFDEDGKLMERLYFYLDRKRGQMILDFLGSDTYKNMSWEDYMKMKEKEGF